MLDDVFYARVWEEVGRIPIGSVCTYGMLARLVGAPQQARRAGRALRFAPEGLPCHRVVNASGRTVPGWHEQVSLLKAEGVPFTEGGAVRLRLCLWRGTNATE